MKNLYISAAEYDYHTLLKVAEMAGLAGIVGFHEAGDGYLVSFPDGENTDTLINDYKSRLKDPGKQHLDALTAYFGGILLLLGGKLIETMPSRRYTDRISFKGEVPHAADENRFL